MFGSVNKAEPEPGSNKVVCREMWETVQVFVNACPWHTPVAAATLLPRCLALTLIKALSLKISSVHIRQLSG